MSQLFLLRQPFPSDDDPFVLKRAGKTGSPTASPSLCGRFLAVLDGLRNGGMQDRLTVMQVTAHGGWGRGPTDGAVSALDPAPAIDAFRTSGKSTHWWALEYEPPIGSTVTYPVDALPTVVLVHLSRCGAEVLFTVWGSTSAFGSDRAVREIVQRLRGHSVQTAFVYEAQRLCDRRIGNARVTVCHSEPTDDPTATDMDHDYLLLLFLILCLRFWERDSGVDPVRVAADLRDAMEALTRGTVQGFFDLVRTVDAWGQSVMLDPDRLR